MIPAKVLLHEADHVNHSKVLCKLDSHQDKLLAQQADMIPAKKKALLRNRYDSLSGRSGLCVTDKLTNLCPETAVLALVRGNKPVQDGRHLTIACFFVCF